MSPARILALAAIAALAAGCDNDVYVMNEIYEVQGDERVPAGASGCRIALDGLFGNGGAGGGTVDQTGDFAVSEHTEDHHFIIVVSSGDVVLERREYSEKFLRSGERDEFSVTTQAGRHYELAYWGGDTCDTSHLPRDADGGR